MKADGIYTIETVSDLFRVRNGFKEIHINTYEELDTIFNNLESGEDTEPFSKIDLGYLTITLVENLKLLIRHKGLVGDYQSGKYLIENTVIPLTDEDVDYLNSLGLSHSLEKNTDLPDLKGKSLDYSLAVMLFNHITNEDITEFSYGKIFIDGVEQISEEKTTNRNLGVW